MRRNRRVRLSEKKLANIVKNSVRKVLKEGSADAWVYDAFEELVNELGVEKVLNELYKWTDQDSLIGFINHVRDDYDMNIESEDEDEEDEDEEEYDDYDYLNEGHIRRGLRRRR